MTGVKLDEDKPRWDLLPMDEAEDIVRVLTFGAKKYAPNNWKHVPGARWRYIAAGFRHLVARARGEMLDPESGLPHTAHAGCCLLFLAWFDRHPEVGRDDGAPERELRALDDLAH